MEGGFEHRQLMELGVIQQAMGELEVTPGLVRRRVTESELGRRGWSGGREMHSAIWDYWQKSEKPLPAGILERMRREAEAHGREVKRGRFQQSTLTGIPMGTPGESMIADMSKEPHSVPAVQCTLVKGQEVERQTCRFGHWELGRGRAVLRLTVGDPIQLERAKLLLWKWRERLGWDDLAEQVIQDCASAEEAEERGFRMPAWQLLSQIRRRSGSTHLVGAPKVMADVHFSSWTTAYDITENTSVEDALILMSALGHAQQEDLVRRLRQGGNWVVVAGVYGLAPGVLEALDEVADSQVVLPMELQGDQVIRHPKVYAKGWWRTGSKKPLPCSALRRRKNSAFRMPTRGSSCGCWRNLESRLICCL